MLNKSSRPFLQTKAATNLLKQLYFNINLMKYIDNYTLFRMTKAISFGGLYVG
jgi:hypothetical protein